MILSHEGARGFVRAVLDAWRPSAIVRDCPAYGTHGVVQVQIANGTDVRDSAVSYDLPVTEDRLRRTIAICLDQVIPIHLRDA